MDLQEQIDTAHNRWTWALDREVVAEPGTIEAAEAQTALADARVAFVAAVNEKVLRELSD